MSTPHVSIAGLLRLLVVGFGGVLAGGCAVLQAAPAPAPTPTFTAVQPTLAPQPRLATGAIYNGRQSDNWFGRGRNFQVGDVITVLLNEATQANRSQSTKVSRDAKNDVIPAGVSTMLGNIRGIPQGLNLNAASIGSTGEGTADQAATLTGSLAVSVIEILGNGNLVVRGEKQLSLSEGSEVIQVSGVIRPDDVAPNNTVQSRRLAHSQISYRGSGDVATASKPGWGTTLMHLLWPF